MSLITGTRLLGEILVADGVTTPEMITAGLTRMQTTGERLGEALVALGAVTKDDVIKALAVQNNLPYLFRGELPSPLPVVKNRSPKYLRQYVVCPIAVEGGLLTVATADPLNPMIVDDLRQSTGLDVRIVVSPGEGILEAIDRTYDGAATPLQRIVEGLEEERGPEGEEDVNHLRDMAFEAPVIRLVNLLVENAIAAEASDIHIEPFEDTLRVRYRIDGILFDQESPPRRLRDAVTSRIKLMAEMNIAERRLPQDGRIRVSLHGRRVDIRVSTIPTVHGESIVMRLLDRASVFLPLEKLGFGSDTLKHFEALIQRPHGILLVTGPTGSGKTTTLYAALEKINSPDRKILTIEDPVEYQLKGVLAQRLVRRICQACRAPETPSAADIEALGVEAPPGVTLYRGLGCDECRNTGYRGRTAIYELFTITEDVRSLILRRASSREIRRLAVEAGMTTLRMDGWSRACEGVTTV